MLSRMMCDALHEADSGEGVIFLTDIAGAPPYRVASLLSHKHSRCEVISGVTLPLIEQMMACRETMTSSEFPGEGLTVLSRWRYSWRILDDNEAQK